MFATSLFLFLFLKFLFVCFSARQKYVRRAWEKAEVDKKWAESSWAKKIEARQKVIIPLSALTAALAEGEDSGVLMHPCLTVNSDEP